MAEHLVAHDAATTLQADGIAPVKVPQETQEKSSLVSARAYTHPALPGRAVVRLEADKLAAAADAEMEALGFALSTVGEGLGRVRHRTIGFPGWAILHDPKHARFALEVTREFKKAAKRAASKPGHAKEAFDGIAARLGRSVPHFLPSYWEEVGRVFMQEGAVQFAAQSFERARLAEKEFSLRVDEDARAEAFLEFALAGAVSVKSLSAYAKDLQKETGAKAAYERFRELAVRRTMGGMPPWAGMGKELRALSKAAGLDTALEDQRVIAELVDSPALARAPAEFWSSYRTALVHVMKGSATARRRLLELFPLSGSSWQPVAQPFAESHFALLEEGGALATLAHKDSGGEGPADLAAWLSRAVAYLGTCDRARALLRDLGPRLREEGRPVKLLVGSAWQKKVSLDLCELALELRVPLVEPDTNQAFEVASAVCDPVLTAADPHYGPLLVSSVGGEFGEAAFEAAARGKRGFLAARRAWLDKQVSALEHGLLIDSDQALEQLERRTTAASFGEFVDLLDRVATVSAVELLHRTLQQGLMDELAWPPYEQAVEELGGNVTLDGAFPYLVVRSASRAIVLGASGRILEHDFALDARTEEPIHSFFLDGALLVIFRDKTEYKQRAYWSHAPKTRLESSGYYHSWGQAYPHSTDLVGQGTTLGGRAVRKGDSDTGTLKAHASDGKVVWVRDYQNNAWGLFELDSGTGKVGRASRPTFFEEFILPDGTLSEDDSWLSPAPPGLVESPLGMRDGLLGMRARTASNRVTLEMVDGTRWDGSVLAPGCGPYGLFRFPASASVRVLARTYAYSSGGPIRRPSLWSLDARRISAPGEDGWSGSAWGKGPVLPAEFWHFAVPRQLEASVALRSVALDTCQTLLDVALGEDDPSRPPSPDRLPSTIAAVGKQIPQARDVRLAGAIAMAAGQAARLTRRLSVLVNRGSAPVQALPEVTTQQALAFHHLLKALDDPATTPDVPSGDWWEWLAHPAARALLLLSPGVAEEDRADGLAILSVLAGSSLMDARHMVRRLWGGVTDWANFARKTRERQGLVAWAAGDSTYVARVQWDSANIVERSATGAFATPAGITMTGEMGFAGLPCRAWLRRLSELVTERGVPAWQSEIPDRLAEATGMTRSEAALLWIGAPGMNNYLKDFLGKERRKLLGLKVAEAEAARGTLRGLPRDALLSILDRAAPDDPADLLAPLQPGADGRTVVERIASAFREKFGTSTALPEELVVALEKDVDPPVGSADLLRALLEPRTAELLSESELDLSVMYESSYAKKIARFDGKVAISLAELIAYLAVQLPAGDPTAAKTPALIAAVRARLKSPSLLISLGTKYSERPDRSDLHRLVDGLGGDPVDLASDASRSCDRCVDNGMIRAAIYSHSVHVAIRPSRIDDVGWDLLGKLDASLTPSNPGMLEALRFLLSADCSTMVERMATPAISAGGFEANPSLSAPRTVERAKAALSLSDLGAVLYLQLLALAEPTSKAVQRWNGWTSKQLGDASAELLACKLVIEGKRERAGRDLFLPGGWLKGSGKDLPMEAWKCSLYQRASSPLPRRLALVPLCQLFERAWARVESRDEPRFEEVS